MCQAELVEAPLSTLDPSMGSRKRENVLEDKTVGENMVSELGLNPAHGVESNQRLEKLREQHAQDAEKETKEEDI